MVANILIFWSDVFSQFLESSPTSLAMLRLTKENQTGLIFEFHSQMKSI